MGNEKKFIGMGNDYMFHVVLQENEEVLRHLIATLLEIKKDDIKSCEIKNPIVPGKSINQKDFILDVKLILNDNRKINIELQMWYRSDWTDRSTLYLCRNYDEIEKGAEYQAVKPLIHIGILDFTLFKDYPEFYAEYKLMNVRNHNVYTDKLSIRVLDLSKVDNAEVDANPELIRWAKIFKAKTMEELEKIVEGEEALKDMTLTLHKMSEEEEVRMQCWAREDYEMSMRSAEYSGKREGIEIGKEIGKEIGYSTGREDEVINSVKEGDYSIERGAQKLGISVEEMKEKLEG